MGNQNIAIETYKYFSKLEGNQHIASEFALKKLIDIIKKYKIKSVLELGLGIGSISFCILEFSKEFNKQIEYVGTESNEFCLEVLPKYLKEHFDSIQIFNVLNEVPNNKKFDLVIIDGKDENLIEVKKIISDRGIIVIEGDRKPQLELVKSIFLDHLYVRLISNQKNPKYGPFSSFTLVGGIQLIFINPNFYQKINFIYYKIGTAIRYRLRAIMK
ncbi:MAG: hypothetical protein K2X95_11155 [Flavobacteriaceae bacterium]|nr:hypothetical protein [Flavobacteriaceae bacterium]